MKPPALHARIRDEIEGRILSGTWPPGHKVPGEHELMAEYGCARMTVNKALSALASAGLIERRRRAGSFVARPRVQSMVLDVPDLASEVAARGQAYAFRLLSREVRAARRGTDGPLGGVGELLELQGVHLADGVPLALERRQVSLAAVPEIAGVDFSAEAPGGWLLRHIPWTEAETTIIAMNCDDAEAARLGVAKGTACLSVERHTWRGATPITHVRQLFPGSAYQLSARFGPRGGG